jgi:SNF2-related domain
MGFVKTITSVSLIAAALQAAKAFEAVPLVTPKLPMLAHHDSDLAAEHFVGRVWGISSPSTPTSSSAAKEITMEAKARDLTEEQYARACRIKCMSRATLVVCPLPTVANWQDKFREHWGGIVHVSGRSEAVLARSHYPTGTQTTLTALFANCANMDTDPADDGRRMAIEDDKKRRTMTPVVADLGDHFCGWHNRQ